jgi:WbqC-like protein family
VEECLGFQDANVASFNTHLLRKTARFLGISTPILRASELAKDNTIVGAENRVLELCTRLRATEYVNSIGGMALYSGARFRKRGIDLCFLSSQAQSYPQHGQVFVPSLSILDVLMFNSATSIQRMLGQFRIVAPPNPDSSPGGGS